MKFLNVEVKVETFQNIAELFWHGRCSKNKLNNVGIKQGFEMGLIEIENDNLEESMVLTEKGYVMARAHFFIERSSLLELEKSLFEARVRLEKEYEGNKDG